MDITVDDLKNHFYLQVDGTRYSYKGIRIGDIIYIPVEQAEHLFNNMAIVTGFNLDHDIVHWKAQTIFGGVSHSGTPVEHIEGHIKKPSSSLSIEWMIDRRRKRWFS